MAPTEHLSCYCLWTAGWLIQKGSQICVWGWCGKFCDGSVIVESIWYPSEDSLSLTNVTCLQLNMYFLLRVMCLSCLCWGQAIITWLVIQLISTLHYNYNHYSYCCNYYKYKMLMYISASGVDKVGNVWAKAQPFMSSALTIFMSTAQSFHTTFYIQYIIQIVCYTQFTVVIHVLVTNYC